MAVVERVPLRLGAPPGLVRVGVGVHGVRSLHDVFRLPELWQFHVYGYSAELTIGGLRYPVRPGSVSLVPPGVVVRFDYTGRSEHLFAHFRTTADGDAVQVPVVQEAGPAAAGLSDLLRSALSASPGATPRVAAEVWTALWRVAQLPEAHGPRRTPRARHPAVGAAIAHIEANLAQPLAVPDVACGAGVSHNHLTRLFRAETGLSVVGYIRQRRIATAHHLRNTSCPLLEPPTMDLQALGRAALARGRPRRSPPYCSPGDGRGACSARHREVWPTRGSVQANPPFP